MSGECERCGEHPVDCECYQRDPANAAEDEAGRIRAGAISDIRAERARQDRKWGVQNHAPAVWMLILGEEVGEAAEEADDFDAACALVDAGRACKEALDDGAAGCGAVELYPLTPDSLKRYRAEMVQVAAVALAAIECLDRNAAMEG